MKAFALFHGVLQITYVENTGAAFSVGQGNVVQYIIISSIVLGIIIRFLILQFEKIDCVTKIMLCLVLAGGISNLIDRIFRRFVLDYIDIGQLLFFPIFNIADAYIVVGWVILVALTIRYTLKEVKSK